MRFFEVINETVEDEVSAQKRAYEAYKIVANAVEKNNFIEVELSNSNRNFYAFEPSKIGLTDVPQELLIMIGLRTSSSGFQGGIWKIDDEPWMSKYSLILVVDGMRKFNEDELRKCVNSTGFLETFQHEFIHILDNQRTQGKISSRKAIDPITNRSGYLNDDAEFNAYFHQYADNWLNCIRDAKEHPEDIEDLKSLYNISGNFQTDLKNLINKSRYSKDFFKTLNEKKRKSILRRLFRLYQEILSRTKN